MQVAAPAPGHAAPAPKKLPVACVRGSGPGGGRSQQQATDSSDGSSLRRKA